MKTEHIKVGKHLLTRFSAPQGFIVYRGVVIVHDNASERVVTLIDSLSLEERETLIAVEQHEGQVRFAWREYVPDRFAVGREVDWCGDSWSIDESFEAGAPE
jgi:hypothetical protein